MKNITRSCLLAAWRRCSGGCITTTTGGFTEEASPQKALEERVSAGAQYIGEGNWEGAKRNLQLAIEIDPNNAEVYEAFALVYQSTGEYELAEENFKKALKLDKKCLALPQQLRGLSVQPGALRRGRGAAGNGGQGYLVFRSPQRICKPGLVSAKLFDPQGAEEAFVRALAMDRTNQNCPVGTGHIRFDAQDYAKPTSTTILTSVSRQQSARALWLGIRLAQAKGDRDAEASYALALSSRFPKSAEYQAYKRTRQSDQ